MNAASNATMHTDVRAVLPFLQGGRVTFDYRNDRSAGGSYAEALDAFLLELDDALPRAADDEKQDGGMLFGGEIGDEYGGSYSVIVFELTAITTAQRRALIDAHWRAWAMAGSETTVPAEGVH